MIHLFLSPHSDDAILSCGGLLHQLASRGERASIVTLFGGVCQPPYPLYVEQMHQLWGSPHDIARLRKAEDEAAAARLGVDLLVLTEHLIACYRRAPAGDWLYPDLNSLFGPVHPPDGDLIPALQRSLEMHFDLSRCQLYAPLGVRLHVDHLIAFNLAMQLQTESKAAPVIFYEDFPYASHKDALAERVDQLPGLSPTHIPLSQEELRAKIEASSYYRSQIPMLFTTHANMPVEFIAYARLVGANVTPALPLAERCWRLP